MAERASPPRLDRSLLGTLTVLVLAGCAARQTSEPPAALDSRRVSACTAEELPKRRADAATLVVDAPEGARIASIAVSGCRNVPALLVRREIALAPGNRIDSQRIAADVRRIWALEMFEDVGVTWDAATRRLTYVVGERPMIDRVYADAALRSELGIAPGTPYEPARLHARALDHAESLVRAGHRRASVTVRGARRGSVVDLCAFADPGPRVLVERLEFIGNERLSAAELRAAMHTEEGAFNVPGGVYDAELLERELLFWSALHMDRGMIEARIRPRVLERASGVQIEIVVDEGPVFRLGKVRIDGNRTGSGLPGVRSGEIFARQKILDAVERLRGEWLAEIELSTEIDRQRREVDLVLQVRSR